MYNRFVTSDIIAELGRGVLSAHDLRERLGVAIDTDAPGERSWTEDPADWSRPSDAIRLASDMAKSGRSTVSAIPNKRIWRSSLCGRTHYTYRSSDGLDAGGHSRGWASCRIG